MSMNQNLGDLMKEAQKLQTRMQEAQKELRNEFVEGTAGGGLVNVEMNCTHEVRKVHVNKTLLEEEISMIEDLVAAAINDAVRKVESRSQKKIQQLTAGLSIPPDMLDKEKEE